MNKAYTYYYINIYIYKYKSCVLGILLVFIFNTFCFGQDVQDIQIASEYYLRGEKNKALQLYKDLAKNPSNISLIHNNYINLLIDLQDYDEAAGYLKQIQKRDPENIQYKLDQGTLYLATGDVSKADKYFKQLIDDYKSDIHSIKIISSYLSSKSLGEYAILSLKRSRDFLGNPFLFTLDLAMLYRIQGQKDDMVREYLSYVTQSSANIQYVKNVMQALLSEPDDLESLERLLYEKVQQSPGVEVYSDLLIWVTMQQKNFYSSFIQARAYDKRYNQEGEKCMEVARVAMDNKDYESAAKIYRYVAKEFHDSKNYLIARLGLIRTREAEIKNSFPIQIDSVKTLIQDYESFIQEYPNNAYSLEAERSEALLYATYLGENDKAIEILRRVIENSRATLYLKAKAKLDLGDIFILKGEPWESTLLYSQVEKTQRDNVLSYEAKLRNAKLSYYKGDFKLAQEHLDILKEATTREIANDAMDLSIRIKENLAYDSNATALRYYTHIELLLYQNKIDEALEKLKDFGKPSKTWMKRDEAVAYNYDGIKSQGDSVLVELQFSQNDAILDDVYWLEANLRMKKGEFDNSILLLNKILSDFPQDVLADDAFFLMGDIYETQLQDKEKAMEVYREFLNKFPGSVYAAEARKRFRTLRGDFDQQVPNN